MLAIGGAVMALAAATAVGAAARWYGEAARVERGRLLADGSAALPGRIAGHEQPLPPAATRCLNCHAAAGGPAATAAPSGALRGAVMGASQGEVRSAVEDAVATTGPAPVLDRAALATPRPRRNGPPSAYDAAAFCRALRSGVDPAAIVLPSTMPRFAPTDAQCADLWAYLVSR